MSWGMRLACALVIATSAPCWAGDAPGVTSMKIKIGGIVGDSLPIGHIIHEAVTKPFIEAVARRTNGDVMIAHFPAEQLGKAKDLLRLTQSGVVDIGYVVPSYASDKMPLTAMAELPGGFRNACR